MLSKDLRSALSYMLCSCKCGNLGKTGCCCVLLPTFVIPKKICEVWGLFGLPFWSGLCTSLPTPRFLHLSTDYQAALTKFIGVVVHNAVLMSERLPQMWQILYVSSLFKRADAVVLACCGHLLSPSCRGSDHKVDISHSLQFHGGNIFEQNICFLNFQVGWHRQLFTSHLYVQWAFLWCEVARTDWCIIP